MRFASSASPETIDSLAEAASEAAAAAAYSGGATAEVGDTDVAVAQLGARMKRVVAQQRSWVGTELVALLVLGRSMADSANSGQLPTLTLTRL